MRGPFFQGEKAIIRVEFKKGEGRTNNHDDKK